MDKRNPEGYMDITPYEALTNLEQNQKRPLVFICSPFAGDIQLNTCRAKRYARFAVNQRAVPVIPHLMYPRFLDEDDVEQRQLGIEMVLRLLENCQEIWVFGSRISAGMKLEIEAAKANNLTIRYFDIQCRPVEGGRA